MKQIWDMFVGSPLYAIVTPFQTELDIPSISSVQYIFDWYELYVLQVYDNI